jgi:hypothetical protein
MVATTGVELGADPAHLALADPGVDAQGGDEVVDLARADAVDVGLHDHRPEGPVDPPPRLQQRREERAGAELGDAQLDVAGLGREEPTPSAVPVGRPTLAPLVPGRRQSPGRPRADQLLEEEGHRVRLTSALPPARMAASSFDKADCGRAIGVSYVNPAKLRNTLRITLVALAPLGQSASGASLKSHDSRGHSCCGRLPDARCVSRSRERSGAPAAGGCAYASRSLDERASPSALPPDWSCGASWRTVASSPLQSESVAGLSTSIRKSRNVCLMRPERPVRAQRGHGVGRV